MIWGMFMAVTMESAVSMGKNYQNNCHSIVNTTDLTVKQMFDISTKVVSEQDEISGLETIGWENHSWNISRKLVTEEASIFNARTSASFRILYCVFGRFSKILNLTMHGGEQRLGWIKSSQNYRNFGQNRWEANGIRVEYVPRVQCIAVQ